MEYKIDEKRVYICRGIPASGKSTWSKEFAHRFFKSVVRLSNDDIRRMMGVYWVPTRETLVKKMKRDAVRMALNAGYSVVVDDMNLDPHQIRSIIDAATNGWNVYTQRKHNDDTLFILRFINVDFPIDVDIAINRDANRHGDEHIGEDVIRHIHEAYHNRIKPGESGPILYQTTYLTYNTKAGEQKYHYGEISKELGMNPPEDLQIFPLYCDNKNEE